MKRDFREAERPAFKKRPRGGRPRTAAVTAVLDTLDTGKAIVFPNEKRARSVRYCAGLILGRERPELIAKRSVHSVWVEYRTGRRT